MLSNYNLIVFAYKSNYLFQKNKDFFSLKAHIFSQIRKRFFTHFPKCLYLLENTTIDKISIYFIECNFFFILFKKKHNFSLTLKHFHIHFFENSDKKNHSLYKKKNLTLFKFEVRFLLLQLKIISFYQPFAF